MQMPFVIRRKMAVCLLVAALLTVWAAAGMAGVPDVAAQAGEGPQLWVEVEALNVREGPGVSYPVIGLLLQGDQVAVIGHHAASGWWQVQLPDGRAGWVSGGAAYVRVSGDTAGVPEVAAPGVSATAAIREQGNTLVFQAVSGGPIYAVNTDGRTGAGAGLRYLTTGIDPALSPNGQQVAFTRWDDTQHGAFGSLWVINVDGTGERPVLGEVRQPKSPVWSPDGTQLAINIQRGGRLAPESKCGKGLPSEPLVADEDGDYFRLVYEKENGVIVDFKICYTLLPHPFWGLRVVQVASGDFEDLPGDLFSYAPTWDPANDWHLVYDGEMGLVNLDLNRGTTWALTDDVNDHAPVFSPDGNRLAVSYWQHDHWDIHVMNADGSGRMRLTETPLRAIVEKQLRGEEPRSWNNDAPAWSPDGALIAFLSDRTGRWEIWVMSADGSNTRLMFPSGTLDGIDLQYFNQNERVLSWW
ncbi:MAG: PD40 domain-containing protein [Anaerolineales bacterium]|nr:MAG: PD40 domain-containing protein [Anaerolineales bacterium]